MLESLPWISVLMVTLYFSMLSEGPEGVRPLRPGRKLPRPNSLFALTVNLSLKTGSCRVQASWNLASPIVRIHYPGKRSGISLVTWEVRTALFNGLHIHGAISCGLAARNGLRFMFQNLGTR